MAFGLSHDEFVKAYQDYMNEYKTNDDLTDEETDDEICEAKELLARALEMLYILGYDSSFTNSSIETLTNDIKEFLKGME